MGHTLDDSQRRAEALVREHRASLLRIARRLCGASTVDPEDLVQETLERALANLERLEERGVESREAWLSATLTHRFLDHCRRRRTEVRALPSLGAVQEQEVAPEGPARESWEQVSDESLRRAIDQLEARHRAAYVLHAQGHKYQAISRELGIPMGTVATWLYQARLQLRRLLKPGTGTMDDVREAGRS
ncbi:RNA polymerase sigma factor [Myxococcaceae bacterium GXIMD 01537]